MRAIDLRIGNYVYDNLGGLLKIKGISTESDLRHIKPIPLTEEILLKCGFDKNINGLYFITICDFYNLELMRIGFEYCSYHTKKNNDEAHSFKRIHYLHQLQNLYFALTGEEITVNL